MDPVRKVLREATVMRFVGEKTTIPVPKVIAFGIAEGKFLGLGPFIIMEFARGERLDECLFDEEDNLRHNIGESVWEIIYRQMARIYLQLSAHSFDSVGGLHLDEAGRDRSWSILTSPITLKMNELERLGGVIVKGKYSPRDLLAYTFANDPLPRQITLALSPQRRNTCSTSPKKACFTSETVRTVSTTRRKHAMRIYLSMR